MLAARQADLRRAMASKKKKAAKAGAGAIGAAQAARSNPYVQRVIEDDELRDNLRTAYDSAEERVLAYVERQGTREGDPGRQEDAEGAEGGRELAEGSGRLPAWQQEEEGRQGQDAAAPHRRRRCGAALSEGLRKKVLDTLFGAEEEFEYTSTTTPSSTGSQTPVGTS